MQLKQVLNLTNTIGGIKNMRYKVLKDIATTDGVLYAGEVVKEWNAAGNQNKIRVKDSMGRIWSIPTIMLKKLIREV